MTVLYCDSVSARHWVGYELLFGKPSRAHDCPERLLLIQSALEQHGLPCESIATQDSPMNASGEFEASGEFHESDTEVLEASESRLHKVHDRDYVEYLQQAYVELSRRDPVPQRTYFPSVFDVTGTSRFTDSPLSKLGTYSTDTFTPITSGSYRVARRCCDLAVEAGQRLIGGSSPIYCLTRPGHHAMAGRMGGYCYLNQAALAAELLAQSGRVCVLDLDIHHGNGTQDIFYRRNDVVTVSIHGDPQHLFPYYYGFEDETGSGKGLAWNRNFPIPPGTEDPDYRQTLEAAIDFCEASKCDFLVVAFGADGHELDPIGRCALSEPFFEEMGRRVLQLGLPTLVTQEGGYNLSTLATCVLRFLTGLGIKPGSESL